MSVGIYHRIEMHLLALVNRYEDEATYLTDQHNDPENVRLLKEMAAEVYRDLTALKARFAALQAIDAGAAVVGYEDVGWSTLNVLVDYGTPYGDDAVIIDKSNLASTITSIEEGIDFEDTAEWTSDETKAVVFLRDLEKRANPAINLFVFYA